MGGKRAVHYLFKIEGTCYLDAERGPKFFLRYLA